MIKNKEAIILSLPAFFVVFIVVVFSVTYSFIVSFYQYRLGDPQERMVWIGLANYKEVFLDSRFWHSLRVTLIYSFVSVVFQLLIGLGLALFLNRSFKGQSIARVAFILPMVIAPVAVGLVFRTLIFSYTFGILNYLLSLVGINPIGWLTDPRWALSSVITIHTWQWTPFVFLVFLASLQSFPLDIYEAARIDGASRWNTFFLITLPLLRPAISIVLVFRLTIALRAFAALWAATEGGPGVTTETLVIRIFKTCFDYLNVGYAATLIVILFLLNFIFTAFLIYFRRVS